MHPTATQLVKPFIKKAGSISFYSYQQQPIYKSISYQLTATVTISCAVTEQLISAFTFQVI